MNMKVIVSLCLSSLILLTGCAKQDSLLQTEETSAASQAVASKAQIALNFSKMSHMNLIGEDLYYIQSKWTDDGREDVIQIFSKQEGDKPKVIYEYGNQVRILSGMADRQGAWYSLYEEVQQDRSAFFLEKIDEHGQRIYDAQTDLYSEILRNENVISSAVTQEGEVCAATYQGSLLIWDSEGKEIGRIETGWDSHSYQQNMNGVVSAGTEAAYVYHIQDNSVFLNKINMESKSLEKDIEIPLPISETNDYNPFSDTAARVKVFGGSEGRLFLAGTDLLWRYDTVAGELTELFSWSDKYVNIQPDFVEQISVVGNGIILLTYDVFQNISSYVRVTYENMDQIAEKTEIRIGCVRGSLVTENLQQMVDSYNNNNNLYHISLEFYGEDGTDEKGREELNRALVQGAGPDLFSLYRLPIHNLDQKGVLEDLRPYLSGSDEVKAEDILEPVRNAMEVNGKIVMVIPYFNIIGSIAVNEVSNNDGISIQECIGAAAQYPESAFLRGADHLMLLNFLLDADIGHFIDWKRKTCTFGSDEFVGLLNAINGLKEGGMDVKDSSASQADQMHQKHYLVDIMPINQMQTFLQVKGAFDGVAHFSGLPTAGGEASYKLDSLSIIGMNSASECKEGCWDFLEYLLSGEYQITQVQGMFPVVEAYFDETVTKVQDDLNLVYNRYSKLDEEIRIPTQDDIDELKTIVKNGFFNLADSMQEIRSIIQEEAEGFFKGGKTAEQAAEIIQSRVFLLLNE